MAKRFVGHGECYIKSNPDKAGREGFEKRSKWELKIVLEAIERNDLQTLGLYAHATSRMDTFLFLRSHENRVVSAWGTHQLDRLLSSRK